MRIRSRAPYCLILRCNFCDRSRRVHTLKNTLGSSMTSFKVVQLLFLFTIEVKSEIIADLLQVSSKTVIDLVIRIQRRLSDLVAAECEPIGGADHIVQLDECCFGKRKYNVGRVGGHKWVFGGIDTTTKCFFTQVVPNRTARVLGDLIIRHVLPGTTVHTDEYPSYLSFFRNHGEYEYGHVNHKYNFVNPETGAHTQSIENLWGQFKRFKRCRGYSKHEYLQSYLDEFLVRRIFPGKERWRFFELLLNLCF